MRYSWALSDEQTACLEDERELVGGFLWRRWGTSFLEPQPGWSLKVAALGTETWHFLTDTTSPTNQYCQISGCGPTSIPV